MTVFDYDDICRGVLLGNIQLEVMRWLVLVVRIGVLGRIRAIEIEARHSCPPQWVRPRV